MEWSLYSQKGFLEPLKFSNGKTQKEVVEEVLSLIKEGEKIIFINGICGTGKSAIALNIAKELGKTSIIVPIKNLQEQYKKDYEDNLYLLKKNKSKLKISVITGRANHKCKFLEEHQSTLPKIRKEINLKLHDIFEGKREETEKKFGKDTSAENFNIPCKVDIKEKNWNIIKSYLKQNKKINLKNFNSIKDVKRMSIAPVCPYWSPVLPDKYEVNLDNAKKKKYKSITGDYTFYDRGGKCSFYNQFNSYIESDVIVFNALKYKFETIVGRKPLTEVEIIDECDEFLDGFANQRNLNLDRLQNSLISLSHSPELEIQIKEWIEIINQIKKNVKIEKAIRTKEILALKETGIYDLMKVMTKNYDLFYEVDEENYVYEFMEITRTFDEFLEETYLTINKKENNLIASLVTTNLEKKFNEIIKKNKCLVLMSGTIHSKEVLKEIFGLQNFKIIDAETESQGRIEIVRTGLEMNCKYSNFLNRVYSREDYLIALDKSVRIAKRPTLVQVNAFLDLPSEEEIERFNLKNLIEREKLNELQREDKTGNDIKKFKNKEIDILFSTKTSRGVDFPGEQCNSIVFTKYPNPNVKDAFWKILMQTRPNYYWNFYKDKARRELWQKVYRGLRSKNDHVYVLSPDTRVLEVFEKN